MENLIAEIPKYASSCEKLENGKFFVTLWSGVSYSADKKSLARNPVQVVPAEVYISELLKTVHGYVDEIIRLKFIKMQYEDLKTRRFTAPIVCLCGSTRFKQVIIWESARLTAEGYIVLSMDLWGHHERRDPDPELKKRLDEIHRKKIDLCDSVYVLDVGGYIGESTAGEIEYAAKKGKPVRYLSKEFPGYVEPVDPIQPLLAENKRLREDLTAVLQTIEASLGEATEAQNAQEQVQAALGEAVGALEKWKIFAHFTQTPVDWRTGESLEDMYTECIQAGEKALSNPFTKTAGEQWKAMKRVAEAYGEFEALSCTYGIQRMAEIPKPVLEETYKAVFDAFQKISEAYEALFEQKEVIACRE